MAAKVNSYERELERMANIVNLTISEAFDEILGFEHSPRVRRQVLAIFNAVASAINFGIAVKNSYELSELQRRVADDEREKDVLIAVVDNVAKQQLRDHELMRCLINDTIR